MKRYRNAIHLLNEIEAWLSFNAMPSKEELSKMRIDIQRFIEEFECEYCGNTGTAKPDFIHPEGTRCPYCS